MTNRYFITVTLMTLLACGCSSWGGKLNNSEGVNYYSKGQYDQALSAFQTAARLNPDDSEIYYNIASTYQQQAARYQDPTLLTLAENNYRQCLQKNPTQETTVCCYRGLATVLNQKKEDTQALKVLKDWEDKEPNSVEPKLEIAYLLEAQGKNAEAAEALTKIKDWAPNDYRAFYKLGLIKEKMGENDAALEQLKNASRLNPTHEEITRKVSALESKISAKNSDEESVSPVAPTPPTAPDSVPAAPATPAETSGVGAQQTGAVGSQPVHQTAPPLTGTPASDPIPAAVPAAESSLPDLGTLSAPTDSSASPLDGDDAFMPFDSTASNTPPASEATFKEPSWIAPTNSDASSAGTASGETFPSYDTPLEETLPAESPTSSTETGDGLPDFTAPLTAVPPAETANLAAKPAPLTSGPAGVQLPDGTGAAPIKLAYSATPNVSNRTVPTTNRTSTATSKKLRIGEQNPGPPRTTVGAPF